jgi:DNA-binding NarL/FixJ family response regulator
MIRVASLDPHPTVRAGADAVLRAQHDLVSVGSAAGSRELWTLLNRTRPDVVLLGLGPHLGDDLGVCLRIKTRLLGPRVVIHAATPGADLVVPATLARADGMVGKAAEVRELLLVLRAVAAGERVLPALTPRLQAAAAARLEPHDRAIYAMRLAGTRRRDIAMTVGLSGRQLDARVRTIIATLADPERRDPPEHPAGVAPAWPDTGDAA